VPLGWLPRWTMAGVVLLYLAACAFGVLEVHYSTDTWIGLAAGRQILSEPTFPKADTFSYPAYGQTWFNQNWLSHVFFWLLYDKLGPDATVIGTWAISAGTFTLVLLATWFRCRSGLAATLAAAIVAIASRDWLSIRPATIQFFLLAAAWLGFSALIGQGARRRWWPMVLLLATYGVWPHAHGSFLFGFGLLGLFLGCAALTGLLAFKFPVRPRIGLSRGATLIGVVLVCTVLMVLLRNKLATLMGWVGMPPALIDAFLRYQMAGLLGGGLALLILLVLTCPARPAIHLSQGAALVAIGLLTAALGAVLSPYGLENFTHPFKVVESDVFRTVGEWIPPYRTARFPGVLRFWIALAIAVATPLAFLMIRVFDAWLRPELPQRPRSAAPNGMLGYTPAPTTEDGPAGRDPRSTGAGLLGLNVMLFDVATVGIGLYMALFARRFAPLFYILATPALVTWIMQLARPLSAGVKRHGRNLVILGAWAGAAVSVYVTYTRAYRELVTDVVRGGTYDLLDRVTHNDHTPLAAVEFLRRNGLTPNVMTEWKVAAAIMFYVPGARVFIDGRAQQVYTEQEYMTYLGLLNAPPSQGAQVAQVLDRCGTDLLLLPNWDVTRRLIDTIEEQRQWRLVLEEPMAAIWVRDGSRLLSELIERDRAGTLWWPDNPETQWRHGLFLAGLQPPDIQRAMPLWQTAVERRPSLGVRAYSWIVNALLKEGRPDEAADYLQQQRARLEKMQNDLPPDLHAQLSDAIRRCEALLPGHGTPQDRSGGEPRR
jgi:hypothetical protein